MSSDIAPGLPNALLVSGCRTIFCYPTCHVILQFYPILTAYLNNITRWFKYDRDYLCVNKSQFVPVIFEPPCRIRMEILSSFMCQFVSRLMGLEFFSFMSLCSPVVLTFKPFIRILQNFVWTSCRLCQLVISNILRSVITTWHMREIVLWQWQCCQFGVYKGCMVTIFEKYSTVDQVILLCRSTVRADIFLDSVLWRWAGHVGCAVRLDVSTSIRGYVWHTWR